MLTEIEANMARGGWSGSWFVQSSLLAIYLEKWLYMYTERQTFNQLLQMVEAHGTTRPNEHGLMETMKRIGAHESKLQWPNDG